MPLNPYQSQQLSDQAIAAYLDSTEESLMVFEELTQKAMEEMSDEEWAALYVACKQAGGQRDAT